MQSRFNRLRSYDKDLFTALSDAAWRVESCLDLRASANHVSSQILDALGGSFDSGLSLMGRCEFEALAADRARQLFNADYACVTPGSVEQAISSICDALLDLGDGILSVGWVGNGHALQAGKFVTAGAAFNCSLHDEVDPRGLDLDALERKMQLLRPRLLVVRVAGIGRGIDYLRLRAIADKARAYLVVDFTLIAGMVAASLCLSPLPFVDLAIASTGSTLRGPEGGMILAKANRPLQQMLDAAAVERDPILRISSGNLAAKALSLKEAMSPSFQSYQVQVLENVRAVAGAFSCRGYELLSCLDEGGPVLVGLAGRPPQSVGVEQVLRRSGICMESGSWPGHGAETDYLRFGTAAITTRGLGPSHCAEIVGWICDILDNPGGIEVEAFVTRRITRVCARYPVYSEFPLIPF
ncbi:hypothetical protein ID144_12320 [Pseudomonas sp. JM0905a]|uniref:hypothetical protein n=1 Tax=Pseudomonas sp. JM0905a TaxID=2772484 RepID=UPI0016825184|nr:hypothetical protein [Pseudomonas sp. JM0905a]MBD2837829.1 hypothetical protein [Pseudomonas sp. JM0905a]